MIFRVSDALLEIADHVNGAGVDARCEPGRSTALKVLNRAIRQLMNEGDWHGMTLPVCLPVDASGIITLDERFETIRLAKWRNGPPIPIYSEGFKFLEGGLDVEASHIPVIVDMGDATPVHGRLPEAMRIMAYSEQVEAEDATLEIRGIDASGREALTALPIRHSWKSAEPPRYTGEDCHRWLTGKWIAIDELRKTLTRGLVYIFGYDPETHRSVWLATLRPDTISPQHRRYRVPGSRSGGQIVAKVVMRWQPLHFETDVLPIQNLDAISRMVQALHALDTSDAGRYEFFRNSAVSQLKKQLQRRDWPAKRGLQVSMRRPLGISRGRRVSFGSCGSGRDDAAQVESAEVVTQIVSYCDPSLNPPPQEATIT